MKVDENEYLLINSRTGAVDVVDEPVIDVLRGDLSDVDLSLLEILKKRGHVTKLSPEEELQQMKDFFEKLFPRLNRIKRYIIIPTYNCNLRCIYCWENELHAKGKEWMKKRLSFEKVDLLFSALDKLNEGVSKKEPLIYFGGEPLLMENMDIITYMMEKGTKRGYTHYIVTNGTTIPYYVHLLKRYPIHGIQVTLDGTVEVHNFRRKGPGGKGTFDKIIEGIKILREMKIKTYIRVNLDKTNINSMVKFADFIKTQGWQRDQFITIYLASVFSHGCGGYPKAFDRESSVHNFISLLNQDSLWEIFHKGIRDIHPLESVLNMGNAWIPRFYSCSAHYNQLFFDPHGDIYTCWEAVGEAEHCVGQFIPNLEFNANYDTWKHRAVFNIEKCRTCEYIFLCGGGCAYAAYKREGTLFAPVCEVRKRVFNEYIAFYYKKFGKKGDFSSMSDLL